MKFKINIIQFLALIAGILIGACSPEDPVTPSLEKIISGKWQPTSYLVDPLAGWKEPSNKTEVTITSESIVIVRYDRYDDSKYLVYELEIESFRNDTIRTGEWKTEPWKVFEANKKLYRRDKTDHDNSIWLQNGSHHIIMKKIFEED